MQGLTDVDGRVTTARAGVASLATGAPVPVDGYFRMGSDTKAFVSGGALGRPGQVPPPASASASARLRRSRVRSA